MFATLVLGLLAHADDRSIVDKMSSPRATVPLLSNPGRQISVCTSRLSRNAAHARVRFACRTRRAARRSPPGPTRAGAKRADSCGPTFP